MGLTSNNWLDAGGNPDRTTMWIHIVKVLLGWMIQVHANLTFSRN